VSRVRARGRTPPQQGVRYDTLWRLALALPGVVEGTSYRTPAFRVGGKLLARLREDGESLVIRIGFLEREALIRADPETFYITDHYLNYPAMLVRLPRVRAAKFRELLEQAWRLVAPKRLVHALDGEERRP
jgi:hypothetical protein